MRSTRVRIVAMYVGAAAAVLAAGLLRSRSGSSTAPADSGPAGSTSAQVLARMEAEGVDVRRTTTVTFALYFPTESGAQSAAAALQREGWPAPVLERPEEPGGSWQVTIVRQMVPTLSGLDSVGTVLSPVAQRFGGEYDGWEADLVR